MAGQMKFEWEFTDTDPFGTKSTPVAKTFSVAYTTKQDRYYSLADTEPVVVWDPTNDTSPASDFDFLLAYCTGGNADVEWTTNITDAATDAVQFFTQRLTSNAALMLGADDSMADHTTGGAISIAAASLDTIDRVRIVNPSSSTTVTVRVVIAT